MGKPSSEFMLALQKGLKEEFKKNPEWKANGIEVSFPGWDTDDQEPEQPVEPAPPKRKPTLEELQARVKARNALTGHICHAHNCKVAVPAKMFMCKKHWYMLPRAKRDAIYREYVDGQEVRKDPTPEYLKVMRECIEFVADKESKGKK
jgi:hypothetical protein